MLADVSDLILQYRVVEITFRQRVKYPQARDSGTASLDLFEDTQTKIVNLYSQIVKCQIRIAYYYSHHGWSRYMKDLCTSDKWQEMQTRIHDSDNAIKVNSSVINDDHLKSALDTQSAQLE